MSALHSLSLFNTRDSWLVDPVEAFAAFILQPDFATNRHGESLVLRSSSVTVYRARWGKFVTACLSGPSQTLATLSSVDLQAFLDPMSPASRHRYVRMLERVFDHLGQLGLSEQNPARALGISAPTRSNQGHAATAVLSTELQDAFLAALPEPVSWKRQRDRALISVILAAGLRVSEAIKLTMEQLGAMQPDGSVTLEVLPTGAVRRHRTRIEAFAVAEVLGWRNQRQVLLVSPDGPVVPGRLLFPADRTGRPLHPATVYRHVAAVLSSAGIPESAIKRRGARTLRSTYAVRALSAGSPVSLVGESMGHVNDKATQHYLAIAVKQAAASGVTSVGGQNKEIESKIEAPILLEH